MTNVIVLPEDTYNRQLIENVHPPDWVNPIPQGRYNMVVIGAGTAGLVTASGAAGLGAKVALIEKHLMGGDCLNYGCVPSKALISASRACSDVRNIGRFGVEFQGETAVNFSQVMERLRRLRAGISVRDSAVRFKGMGIDVFLGEASFVDPNTIAVDGENLRFKKACIATGARANGPQIPGLKEVGYLTNESVFSLTQLPKTLAVIGAGPIGCEMAQAFQRFGSKVHLLEVAPQILIREDQDAANLIEKAMNKDGVAILTGTKIASIELKNGKKLIHVERGGERKELLVDEILVGLGRIPNIEGLNLEAAGIEYDRKSGVKVNDRLQTTNRKVYAAGDICSMYKFTHTADALARIVIQNALFRGRIKASALTIPWCTYTDPEIAHVGMYEKEAKEKGIGTTTFTRELNDVDRAILDGEEGLVKIHVKSGTDKIIGATIVARHAGEMISEITLAMVGGLGLSTISKTIHPYPTQADAIKQAGDAYNRARLTPFVKGLFSRWFSWTR